METQNRWAPTLPSFGGRLAPRVELPEGYPSGYNSKLELYYLKRQSCLSIFSHHVGTAELRRYGGRQTPDNYLRAGGCLPFLKDCPSAFKYKYLMGTFGKITMSLNFQRKLQRLCEAGDMATIKRWWQTADGVVLPLLLTAENPDDHYVDIDKLIKFSFENCANNYARFTARMKSLKRLLRKDYAEMRDSAKAMTDVTTYRKMFEKHRPDDGADPHKQVRYLLIWAQTRASGLADSVMIKQSLDKCENTLSTPRRTPRRSTPETREYSYRGLPQDEPPLPRGILDNVCWRVSDRLKGELAHLSAGPNACLESTRQTGGQTGHIMTLARRRDSLHQVYNFRTLEVERCSPRPIRSQNDLLSWAIQEALEHPTYVRCVRLHAVAEPSKARTITVCTLPYLLIVGVLSKLLQPAIASDITRGGLHASRNLWNFLFNDLDPNLGLWASIRDEMPKEQDIMGLSSDLSEATDYGDIGVARQLLANLLEKCSSVPGFPTGLGQLAKTLFIGKRFCLRHENGKGYRFFVKRNGWLMGDRLTKVILTLAHEIVVISSGLHCARICGDDVIAFSRNREKLEKYFSEVQRLGFKLSEEDSYISSRLAFYCEEGCIPPQRYRDLPSVCVRRKHQSMYIDYPRIRLLIPTCIETHAYSYTDCGRFALLGKETRWVCQGGLTDQFPLFHRAGLLQHLNVPQPADTMCPYLPIEIGGDGAFPIDRDFLREVVYMKSRDFRETSFRMVQLLNSKWGFRYVRSANLNDVIHKYHILVPKIQELRQLLPPEAIIEGNELLLGSIKVDGVETPERTFFRIWRAWYWRNILETGMEPPTLQLGTERFFSHRPTDINISELDVWRFHQHWRDSGFTFRDTPSYLVDTRKVHVLDYMNMGWNFGLRPMWSSKRPTLDEVGGRKLLNEENVESFIDHMKDGRPLSPIVAETLYKYVEADSYILAEAERRWRSPEERPACVVLVSGDKRLACEILRMIRAPVSHQGYVVDTSRHVVLVHPENYLFGMMSYFEDWTKAYYAEEKVETIVDFGAVNYAAFLSLGQGTWYDDPVIEVRPIWGDPQHGVLEASIVSELSPYREQWSLTTQTPDQIRKLIRLAPRSAR